MSATLINTTVILNEMLALLTTSNAAIGAVNRQYDSRFASGGVTGKAGTSLQVRKPVQVTSRTGKVANLQDTVEQSVTINCSTQIGVDLPAFTSEDVTMKIDDFSNRYLKPAAATLAGLVDVDICSKLMLGTASTVGTPGTVPQTEAVWAEAIQKLHEANVPNNGNITALTNPSTFMKMSTIIGAKYQPLTEASTAFRRGVIPSNYGIDYAMDQNIATLTCGSRVGTILTNGAVSTGATTIALDGLTNATDTVKAGEVFTIAGVYDVNPITKVSYGSLKQFVVTADAVAISNAIAALAISPTIYGPTSGALQNVSALPANDKAITFVGTASTAYPQNIVLHRDALTLVTADLVVPQGTHQAGREVMDGISLRMITDYNAVTDEFITRFDVYYGASMLDMAKAVRVWS